MLSEQARKLIDEWDEARGPAWSDCSEDIADIMMGFAKAQIAELLNELAMIHARSCIERDSGDDVSLGPLEDLIQEWRAKL